MVLISHVHPFPFIFNDRPPEPTPNTSNNGVGNIRVVEPTCQAPNRPLPPTPDEQEEEEEDESNDGTLLVRRVREVKQSLSLSSFLLFRSSG